MPVNRLAGNACCHHVDGMPTAATDVGDVDAGAKPVGQAVGHRQDDVDERGVEHLAALLGHQLVEARIVAVGQPAAVVEAADDLLFDLAEQRDELRDAGQVVRPGGAGQHRRAVARERVRLRGRVVIDDAAGHHPAQPLAHIAFVEPGGVGDLGAGGGRQFGQRVEQLGLMADRQQDGQAGAVDRSDDALGEFLGRCRSRFSFIVVMDETLGRRGSAAASGKLCKFRVAMWCK